MPDNNLLAPGECEKPFPVPPLERVYRIYVPLLNLAAANGRTPVVPPLTPSASLNFNAIQAARMERAADAFGGIPLNALDSADDPRWTEPTLGAVEVRDPASLIRKMAVIERGERDTTVRLALTDEHVGELLGTGVTLAPRAEGGFVRLKLSPDASKPLVRQVDDLQGFLSDPAVVLRDGRRRALRLSTAELSRLAAGAPVVSGSGSSAVVLLRSKRSLGGLTPVDPGTPPQTSSTNIPPATGSTGTIRAPELAVLLALDQKWLLKTYERGRLVSSISLTPQEEVTVDVFSWDRRKTSREDTVSFDTETNAESQSVDRDTRDVFGELTRNGNFGFGLNGSYSGYGLTIGGGINNGNTVNRVTRDTRQHVHEQTTKASAKVHASRQIKITESTEEGSETRTTRKLRNNNLCHAVTFHYFELLGRYVVSTGFAKSETAFVLLVDNPLARPTYDFDYVRTYESVIRRALLDPAVASGIDAARTMWTLAHAAETVCNDCPCPGDMAGSEDSGDFAQAVAAVRSIVTALTALDRARRISWSLYFTSLVHPPNLATGLPGIPGLLEVRRALFVDAIEQVAPGLLASLEALCAPLATGSVTATQLRAFATQFAAVDLNKIDAALTPEADLQKILPGLLEPRIRDTYTGVAKETVEAIIAGNRTGNAFIDGIVLTFSHAVLSESSCMDIIINAITGAMNQSPGFAATNSAGLDQALKTASTMLAAWTKGSDESAAEAAETRKAHQTLYASVFPATTVLAARERFDALVKHLRAYGDYYATAIITDLIARGQFPVPAELLPFLDFVSPNPVAVVNGKLAYPVDLSSPSLAGASTLLQNVVDSIPDDTTSGEVTLPTPGFVVEPKLSCCSACEEFVEKSRTIELDLRQAQADQAKREADRRAALLAQTPPRLDPFEPCEPKLQVDLKQSTTRPGP